MNLMKQKDHMKAYPKNNIPPRGRGSSRCFLFLIFFHLLPFPWYMAVAGGLAPATFLFAGVIFYLFAWLLAVLIGKF